MGILSREMVGQLEMEMLDPKRVLNMETIGPMKVCCRERLGSRSSIEDIGRG